MSSRSHERPRCYFNPRSREGSDIFFASISVSQFSFQSTLPRRERPLMTVTAGASRAFQSTLPRRERLVQRRPHVAGDEFQSTLPRRERRHVHAAIERVRCISIHAPAKGATGGLTRVNERGGISIHAPAKGATTQHLMQWPRLSFQSTLPRRERLIAVVFRIAIEIFQSTLPRRERPSDFRIRFYDKAFQSTLPRRERHGANTTC